MHKGSFLGNSYLVCSCICALLVFSVNMKRLLFLIMISRKTGTGISKLGDPFFDTLHRRTKTRDEDPTTVKTDIPAAV